MRQNVIDITFRLVYADVSLQTILNASNSIVDKKINEIDNDNLIRQSLTGNTSIDYYN